MIMVARSGQGPFLAPPIYTPEGRLRIGRLLVANRGEIACRIIDACRKLGIASIAVYADVDENSPHVRKANEAFHLGSVEKQPYQNGALIIEVARKLGADAIHPGYGYLSENADFARAVISAGIIFVGPSPETIAALGDKSEAKAYLRQKSSVPLIPGYHGFDQDSRMLKTEADKIGYPVLIKASAGGGGKGMRIVKSREEFEESFARCASEAERSFGSRHCLIEKYIEDGKHVEIQIFGDGQTSMSFLDRECSIQRRHQKIVEESPCPWMGPEMRKQMSDSAVEIADLLKYKSAGTVEFIVDISAEKFYFLEVNTRIQVEHPITEEVVGVDLVALQLFVAAGGKLSSLPELKAVRQHGHAIEVRLCAEDPFNDFLPCTGTVQLFKTASESLRSSLPDVRYELGIESGSKISVHFDSMICKVIVWSHDRPSALLKMLSALKNTICLGVTTNQLFLQRVVAHPAFQKVDYTTGFIERNRESLLQPADSALLQGPLALTAAIFYRATRQELSPASAFGTIPRSYRNQSKDKASIPTDHVSCELGSLGYAETLNLAVANHGHGVYKTRLVQDEVPVTAAETKTYFNKAGGPLVKRYYTAFGSRSTEVRSFHVRVQNLSSCRGKDSFQGEVRLAIDGRSMTYFVATGPAGLKTTVYVQCPDAGLSAPYKIANRLTWAGRLDERIRGTLENADKNKYVSPMPCTILQILIEDGAEVKVGEGLLVMESMKTEVRIAAAGAGVVRMHVKKGDNVQEGVILCEILDGKAESC